MLLLLEHGLEARAQRERRLASAGAAAERDDADLGVEQEVDRESLLGAAAVQTEDVAVAAHEGHLAATAHAAEGRAAVGVQDEPGVHRQVFHKAGVQLLVVVELRHLLGAEGEIRLARPAGVDREFGPILLGRQTDGCRLHPQRKVLRHDRDGQPLVGEVERNRKDARVVVTQLQPGGQYRHVGVVELDAQRAAVADRDREVEALVLDAQLIEVAQRLTREVADLGIVALGFKLGHDDHGKHDVMLGESEDGLRIGEEHRGIENVRALGLGSPRAPRLRRVLRRLG